MTANRVRPLPVSPRPPGAKPRISVVVPTFEEVSRIGDCLVSVGASPEIEIVITDGGSTDGTLDAVDAVARAAVVITGPAGRGGQLNRGAAVASADRLLFLHADCVLPDGWFDPVMEALEDRSVVLATFWLHTVPAGGGRPGFWRRFWLSLFDLRSRGWGLPYGDQGFALRREVFDELGGFPDIPLMEDFALARKCRRRGRIRVIPLRVRTTARRFERRAIRSRLILAVFPTLFKLGVQPSTLARWYGVVR